MIRFYGECIDSPAHREQGGMVNIESVDFPDFRQTNADGCCCAADYAFHFYSLLDIEPFGIVNTGKLSAWWKDDRGRYYGTGKRPRPGFINAGNRLDA